MTGSDRGGGQDLPMTDGYIDLGKVFGCPVCGGPMATAFSDLRAWMGKQCLDCGHEEDIEIELAQ